MEDDAIAIDSSSDDDDNSTTTSKDFTDNVGRLAARSIPYNDHDDDDDDGDLMASTDSEEDSDANDGVKKGDGNDQTSSFAVSRKLATDIAVDNDTDSDYNESDDNISPTGVATAHFHNNDDKQRRSPRLKTKKRQPSTFLDSSDEEEESYNTLKPPCNDKPGEIIDLCSP